MTAIIFGAKGQDGFYLSKLLTLNRVTVIPIYRFDPSSFSPDLCYNIDISNFNHVSGLIKSIQPSYVFHLAANSTTNHEAIFDNHNTICTGTLNILEAVKMHSPKSKVFISGSALQFINNNIPISETDEFQARDAYSVSRIYSVYLSRYYQNLGLNIYIGYFFNHDSPLRSERHISKKITETAKRISQGSKEKLFIGNIDFIKEWNFAGDMVEAIWLFVNQDLVHEINLGSGIAYSIEEWVTECFSIVGLKSKSYIEINTEFKSQYKKLISNSTLLYSLGWSPVTTFTDLAKMMMQD